MLSIIEDKTRGPNELIDTNLLVGKATERGITAKVCDFRDLDLADRGLGLGSWIFTRSVLEARPSVLMAARSYLKDKIIMNSALFFRPGTGNKYHQQLVFASSESLSGYAIPTYPIDSQADVLSLVKKGALNLPLVIKPDNGSQGYMVRVIRSLKELSRIGSFSKMVAQPYIEFDHEWRVYVMGGTALSAGRAENSIGTGSRPGFRDRLLETNKDVVRELNQISLAATSLLGLEYSGVDIMREKSTGRFFIIEANVLAAIAMPHYSKNTGEDLPREVIDWFIERDKLINQKLPLERCLHNYLTPRLKRLTAKTQRRVRATLDHSEKPACQLTESEIRKNFFNVPVEHKLRFLYGQLVMGATVPKITDIILGEAEQSVSWAGNFLVDRQNQASTALSTAHTLENGAPASAYYIAAKRLLAKR